MVATYNFKTGFSKRNEAMNRFIPTGGVEYPIPKLAKKIIPRCTGSTPKLIAIGAIKGTTTRMAEKISSIAPTINRNKFNTSKKAIFEVINVFIQSRICIGISS